MKPINDCFLRALKREKTDFTPVWLMRQAGRYLPEYCETRARAGSFMGLAMNPDYATEVTLQPIDRYGLDAAILFSDILTVPDAMGLGLHFVAGEGPVFDHPVQSVFFLHLPVLFFLHSIFVSYLLLLHLYYKYRQLFLWHFPKVIQNFYKLFSCYFRIFLMTLAMINTVEAFLLLFLLYPHDSIFPQIFFLNIV